MKYLPLLTFLKGRRLRYIGRCSDSLLDDFDPTQEQGQQSQSRLKAVIEF
jgi:hypothetical protein